MYSQGYLILEQSSLVLSWGKSDPLTISPDKLYDITLLYGPQEMTGFQQMVQERDLDDIWLPEAVPETDDILAIDDHSPHQTSGATEGSDELSLPGSVKNISFEAVSYTHLTLPTKA